MIKFQPAGVRAMASVGKKSPKRLRAHGRLGDGAREHIFNLNSISLSGAWRESRIEAAIRTSEISYIRQVSLSFRYRSPRKNSETGIITESYNDTLSPNAARIPGSITRGINRNGHWFLWISESPESEGIMMSQAPPMKYPISFSAKPASREVTITWTINRSLEAGETLNLPPVAMNRGERDRIFKAWRQDWINAAPRTLSDDRRRGWCDEADIQSPKDLREELVAIRSRKIPIDWFALSPRYTASTGDWLTPSEAFRDRMGSVTRSIGEANLTPGLRFAPFLVSRSSKIAQDNRDWLVKNGNGNPLTRPAYLKGGDSNYILDVTNPAVIQHIKRVFSVMRDQWGFRVFILERLDDLNLPGDRTDNLKSPGELADASARLIRESVGNKVMLIASGFPLLCSPGIWDARISVPVPRNPKTSSKSFRQRSAAAAAAIIHRSMWREPLWINAFGPFPLTQIGPNCGTAAASLRNAVILASGMVILSGDPRTLDDANASVVVDLLTRFEACRRGRLSVVTNVGGGHKTPLITRNNKGWIGLFNLTGRKREVRLERDTLKTLLGVNGPLSAGDGAIFNSPDIHVALPARGHRLFRA